MASVLSKSIYTDEEIKNFIIYTAEDAIHDPMYMYMHHSLYSPEAVQNFVKNITAASEVISKHEYDISVKQNKWLSSQIAINVGNLQHNYYFKNISLGGEPRDKKCDREFKKKIKEVVENYILEDALQKLLELESLVTTKRQKKALYKNIYKMLEEIEKYYKFDGLLHILCRCV